MSKTSKHRLAMRGLTYLPDPLVHDPALIAFAQNDEYHYPADCESARIQTDLPANDETARSLQEKVDEEFDFDNPLGACTHHQRALPAMWSASFPRNMR